jgi:hypothetical protein
MGPFLVANTYDMVNFRKGMPLTGNFLPHCGKPLPAALSRLSAKL